MEFLSLLSLDWSGLPSLPFPMALAVATEDGEAGLVTMELSQPGNQMTASGSADAPRYDFDYPTMILSDLEMTGTDGGR